MGVPRDYEVGTEEALSWLRANEPTYYYVIPRAKLQGIVKAIVDGVDSDRIKRAQKGRK